MNAFTANIKQYYQRRGLWFWYAWMLLFSFPGIYIPMVQGEPGKGVYIIFLVFSLIFGLIAGSMQREVISKPFSFTLPGHRRLIPRTIISFGIILHLIICLPVLANPQAALANSILPYLAAITLGITVFTIAGLVVFLAKNYQAFAGFLPLIIFSAGMFQVHIFLEKLILQYPFWLISLGIMICGLISYYISRPETMRRLCAVPVLGMFDGYNREKMEKFRRKYAAKKLEKQGENRGSGILNFFLTLMQQKPYYSNIRYTFGSLYIVVGRIVALSMLKQLIPMLIVIVWFSYWREDAIRDIFFVLPYFGAMQWHLVSQFTALLPASRKQKYLASISSAAVIILIGTLFMAALAGISILLTPYMPPLTIERIPNFAFEFKPINISHLWITPMVMPLAMIMTILFRRNLFICSMPAIIMLATWIPLNWRQPLTENGFPAILTLTAALFIILGALLYRHCFRKDLVTQTR